MAQGKLKVKSKVPDSVAKKKKQLNVQQKKQVEKNRKKKPRAKGLQLSANFNKDLTKKINASIQSDLASTCHKVEEGKSFIVKNHKRVIDKINCHFNYKNCNNKKQ